MVGQGDLVMGSFSKSFASNGGFVTSHDPSVKRSLGIYGGPHICSNALPPCRRRWRSKRSASSAGPRATACAWGRLYSGTRQPLAERLNA